MAYTIAFYTLAPQEIVDGFLNYQSDKDAVYRDFFRHLRDAGCDVVFASQAEYQGDRVFRDIPIFDGENIVPRRGDVTVDLLFDRSSAKQSLPKELATIAFSTPDFKMLCADKNETYRVLGSFMARSVAIESDGDLSKALAVCNQSDRYVLKPAFGMKGRGIIIGTPAEITAAVPVVEEAYILQEFIDMSAGVPGIADGIHDIRVIIIGDQVIMASVRIPAAGKMLANVAQGGTIREIPYDSLPASLRSVVRQVQDILNSRYDQQMYAIDFGMSGDRAYIFELNDRIGFPNDTMPSASLFAAALAARLLRGRHD